MKKNTIRVLLIDDTLTDRELIKNALLENSSTEYEITEAKSSKEFYSVLGSGNFDIVLSDFNILGFEGTETIEAVKKVNPDLPVIIVTGTGSEEIAVRCLKEGAADYLLKTSHDIFRLPHTISAVLEKVQLENKQKRYLAELSFAAQLIQNVSDAIISTDSNFNITTWNSGAEQLYGWEIVEALGRNIFDLIYLEKTDHNENNWTEKISKSDHWQGEVTQVHKNGNKITVSSAITILGNPEIVGEGFVFVNRDVSEQKLRDTLAAVRVKLIEYSLDHSMIEIMQNAIDTVERLTESKLGFFHFLDNDEKKIEMTAWSSQTIMPPWLTNELGSSYDVDRAGVWADCIHQRKPVVHNDYPSVPHRRGVPEGHPEIVRELVVPLFRGAKIVAILGVGNKPVDYEEKDIQIAKDVADIALTLANEKRAKEALEVSEKNYRRIVENQTELVNCWLPDGTLTFINEAYSKFYGIPAEELIGTKWIEAFQSLEKDQGRLMLKEILSSISPSNPIHMDIHPEVAWDGSLHWQSWIDKGIFDESGNLLEVQAVGRDITEIKQAEEEVRASEEKFKFIFDNSIIGKSLTLPGGELQVNNALCTMLGYSKEELERMRWPDITYPDDIENQQNVVDTLLSGKQSSTRFVKRFLHKNGDVIWADFSTYLRRDGEGKPLYFISAILDITEQVKQREEINLHVADMGLINQAAISISQCKTTKDVCQTAINYLQQHPNWLNVYIIITKESGNVLDCVTSNNPIYEERISEIFRDQKIDIKIKSLLEEQFEKKQILLSHDLPEGINFQGLFSHMRSGIYAPLIIADDRPGILCIESEHESAFEEHSIEIIGTFSELITNSLKKLLLSSESEKRLKRIESLRTIDQAITSTTELELVVDIILEQCIRQLNIEGASIFLFNRNLNQLELVKQHDIAGLPEADSSIGINDSVLGLVVRKREMVHISDFSTASPGRMAGLKEKEVSDYYAVPLVTKGEIKGVLEVFHRSKINLSNDWLAFLKILSNQAAIAIDNAKLFSDLQKQNFDLLMAYDETLEGWAKALDIRDADTEGHTRRVVELCLKLGQAIGVSDTEILKIRRGALLHDIGKLGIPDEILLKPGKLSDEEWEIMRMHPVYAYNVISPIEYLRPALDIPYCHHEKWDGTGYPRGLKEREIPLSARIFSVVDVYDALTSDRPYRNAWPEEKALEYIKEQSGKDFDPDIVQQFLQLMEKEK